MGLVFASLVADISSLDCTHPCQPSSCPEQVDCAHGLVFDSCLCCQVCGKGEGESCGNLYGRCGDGLECVKPAGTSVAHVDFVPGVCRVKRELRCSEVFHRKS